MFSSTSRNFIKGFVSNSANRPLIAVCQLTSTHDVEQNFRIISTMIERAKQRNAQVFILLLTQIGSGRVNIIPDGVSP